jgi:pimeloyl-ACP methyl ester carboxylesterase
MTGCSGDCAYAGREQLAREYRLIAPDARGHGRSTNPPKTITHRQCALDTLALLDHLDVKRRKAIGVSMGANTLRHLATMRPDRIEAMVLVSAAMYFPEQARAIVRQIQVAGHTPGEWESMRQRHKLGDEQSVTLWEQQRALAESYDDVTFTPPYLSRITASTLIVYGDRDPLYPVEMAVEMYRSIPGRRLDCAERRPRARVLGSCAGFCQGGARLLFELVFDTAKSWLAKTRLPQDSPPHVGTFWGNGSITFYA